MQVKRLSGDAAFSRIFDEGRTVVGRYVVIHYLESDQGGMRAAFAAGKKLGGAVVRNRLRRRLREAVRTLPGEGVSAEAVFIARRSMMDASFSELQDELGGLLGRADLIETCGCTWGRVLQRGCRST